MSHDFKISSQGWALFLTLVSAVLIYLGVVRYKFKKVGKHDPIAFVSGKYGRASLSLLQILLWTLLVFFASVYVWLVSGELLELTDQVLILLGIAGGSSLIAKITASTRDEKGQLATALANDDKRAAAATPETTRTPRWEDLFQTAGRPDLHKVQMAMFTVLALFYALVEIVDSLTFPELPNELLILIGISNGVYIGAKAVGKSDYDKLAEKDRELTQARQALEALKTDRGKAKRSATAAEKAHTAAAAGADKQAKKTSLDEAKEEVTRIEKSIETAEAGLAAKQAEFDELRKKVMG